jgi:hypothetical protein
MYSMFFGTQMLCMATHFCLTAFTCNKCIHVRCTVFAGVLEI